MTISPRIKGLLEAATRSNGKCLLTAADAAELLSQHADLGAKTYFLKTPPLPQRIVQFDCSVCFAGRSWFIPAHYGPGDLVDCQPTRKGAFLRIQDPHKSKPDILAVPAGPVRNQPHTDQTAGTDVYWGKPTRTHQDGSGSGGHQFGTQKMPPRATAQGNKRNHISGTGHVAPGGGHSTPIVLVLQIPACTSPCKKCRCKSPRS